MHRQATIANRIWIVCFAFLCLFVALRAEAADNKPLRVMFIVNGHVKVPGIEPQQQNEASMRMEGLLEDKLLALLPIENFDQEALKAAKQNAEAMAALEGGSADDIREALKQYELDAFIRVNYRTAPVVKALGSYSATAALVAEVVDLKSAEKAIMIESPAMGTPENPAVRDAGAYNAALAALEKAADGLIAVLKTSEPIQRLQAGKSMTPSVEAGDAEPVGKRVIFIVNGKVAPTQANGIDLIDKDDSRVMANILEANLNRKLRDLLQIRNFDKETLDKVRADAEAWAALSGDNLEQIQQVLNKYGIDVIVKASYHTEDVHRRPDPDKTTALYMYSGTANVTAFLIDKTTAKKTVAFSPKMGTEAHPAKLAIDPFDAGMGALDYATDQMLAKLRQKAGMAAAAPETKPEAAGPEEDAGPQKPTVAVLWVRPEFGPWRIPRGRQPGRTLKARKKMKEFVKHVKETGSIGVQVSDYLVKGIMESGAFTMLEDSKQAQAQMQAVNSKLRELRAQGWVKEKLASSDPAALAKQLGKVDYVITARITEIKEHTSSVSFGLFSKGSIKAIAEAEVVVTNAATGETQTYTGSGDFTKKGWGTVMEFSPESMSLSGMMIGGAIQEALLEAARKIRM